jgi:hypothetical protein
MLSFGIQNRQRTYHFSCSFAGGNTKTNHPGDVSIAKSLANKPSGCVVWIRIQRDLEMGPFFWFGGAPGEPLPSIEEFPAHYGRHTIKMANGQLE